MVEELYYAHSTAKPDKRDWQKLKDHLDSVAERAAGFGQHIGIERPARLTGLMHDLGKYTPRFQARLTGSLERVDHSTAGAALVRELAEGGDRAIAELAAYCIAGHHAGLPNMRGTAGGLADRIGTFDRSVLDNVWRSELRPDASDLVPNMQFSKDRNRFAFQFAFLGRMLFSCLVDADFKDTESFYASTEGRSVDRDWPSLQSLVPELKARLDERLARFSPEASKVNRLRADILSHVRRQAAERPGLFTLTVPTGGGKTLASLAFALDHAKVHGHRRIIYTIPFTSITEQTSAIFRDVIGEKHVLEHHSAIEEETFDPREREGRNKLKLAMEDWAAPIVVTTNVQFFESLFAARTSRSRKLHNVASSIIILDEAQTLPRHLLAPAARALDELALNYGCTIVLCTATQPALDARNFPEGHPVGLPLEGRELAPDPADLARRLKRVTLHHAGDMDDATLVDALSQHGQALVIVNSRKHALDLYESAVGPGLDGVVHLTTRQCAAHRRKILEEVRRRLKEDEPCRVIATSLIEAGVDVDFPRVWRAEAGLDQIAQAAGRANREGKRPVEESVVTVFTAPDNPPPAEIRSLSGDMQRMMDKHDDLLSPAAIADFFGEVYWRMGDRLDGKAILGDFRVDATGTDFAYRTVAEKFRMIESGMAPVVIVRDDKARQTLDKMAGGFLPAGAAARALQNYIVQVPPKARALLLANGHVSFEREDLFGDQFAVLRTGSLYREETGLVWEDAEYLYIEGGMI